MTNLPIPAGHRPSPHAGRAAPMTGILIGTGLSLLLWALILAIVLAVR